MSTGPDNPAPPAAGPQRTSPHSASNRLARVAWAVVYRLLFRPSPRPLHAWRNWLLRLFGARLHPTARVYPTAKVWAPWLLTMAEKSTLGDDVDCYCVGGIEIGAFTTVSQYAHLCGATHDFNRESFPLEPRPIRIGSRCWIAADVFVAPGVTIADGVVVGARSGVFRDLPAWVVAAGTPARAVRPREAPRPG